LRVTRKQRERRAQEALEIQAVVEQTGMDALSSHQVVALLQETEGKIEWAATSTLVARGKAAIDALLEGMKHSNSKVRATSALLLDHVADDRCIEPLLHALRQDPHEAVRRCAMHSLVCDGCKECPLHVDVVGALLESLQNDRSMSVKRRAVFYLSQQAPDIRTRQAFDALLLSATDPILRRRAQAALDSGYSSRLSS
jgi:HEAT repeat protein